MFERSVAMLVSPPASSGYDRYLLRKTIEYVDQEGKNTEAYTVLERHLDQILISTSDLQDIVAEVGRDHLKLVDGLPDELIPMDEDQGPARPLVNEMGEDDSFADPRGEGPRAAGGCFGPRRRRWRPGPHVFC